MEQIAAILARELNCTVSHGENIIQLIDEGNTIPFIARYRKELHGAMDDQALRAFAERLQYLRNLDARKEEVKASIAAQEKWTQELEQALSAAVTLAEVEDLYRPYKPKRRTRASMARDKGLAPLAELLLAQEERGTPLLELAMPYVDREKGVETPEDALQGASDIIAEEISDDAALRKKLRERLAREGLLQAKAAKEEDSVYRLYYAFQSPLAKLQGHQILAINRGEREGYLKASVFMEQEAAHKLLVQTVVRPGSVSSAFVEAAAKDAWDRLLFPSLEREVRSDLTESAANGAIRVFGLNLKQLLMQPPVSGKAALGLDPAYRTGCKLAVVDATGKVLDTAVIYPTAPHNRIKEAGEALKKLIEQHDVEVIAIGNGTASRESEQFVADVLKELPRKVAYMVVSEAGASVYSASKLAAEEFPMYDVSLRSAVSIARRLLDPLAELVKIDPKAIGVGQYQHDMPKARLDEALYGVVEDCVNGVGVDVNTASAPLLTHVAGLTAATAKNIVAYREENGPFTARRELKKVPKLGPKAFEQCAGFLRVPGSKDILDNTGVHPESYKAARQLLELCGHTMEDVAARQCGDMKKRLGDLGMEQAQALCGVGAHTLSDIASELEKPGRDPREDLPPPLLRTQAMDLKDLKPGMQLVGTVRNVIDFGAFVDVGVHQDGLVHISQIADRYIKHPADAVSVGDIVRVVVLDVDVAKGRLALSMRQADKGRQ